MTGSLCRRFGPGRLPYASRRDVGGGIAMAATALLAVVVWFGGAILLLASDTVTTAGDLEFAVTFGVFFAPFAVVTGFGFGTLCWRAVDRGGPDPHVGALLGACTAAGSLVGGAAGLTVVVTGTMVVTESLGPIDAVAITALVLVSASAFAIAFAGWLIVPLGAFGGWYHERAKLSTKDSRRATESGKL